MSGDENTELDLGKMLFGDHKCFHCERVVHDYEKHIHVPLNDYMREEMGQEMPGQLGAEATIIFCSECTVEAEEGYGAEEHEVDVEVPDTIPEEWFT